MSDKIRSAEEGIQSRYERWSTQDVDFRYKRKKAARIVMLIRELGGLDNRALELGVGPGGIAAAVSDTGMKVIGVDLSAQALDKARSHCAGRNVTLVRASGFQLPFADQTFPVMYAPQVLHLFDSENRQRLLLEAYRVLMPGGRLLFDLLNKWSHPVEYWKAQPRRRRKRFPDRDDVLKLVSNAGFADITVRAGVVPGLPVQAVPNSGLSRFLAHTVFVFARRPPDR
jgi:ubiquinone/menaquinone biosynthesis C-methylase UbiE